MYISQSELDFLRGYDAKIKPTDALMQAAVAIILRDSEHGTEFLLMQRAKHENDPWSGQMSFPGGKIDPEDVNAKAAAIREAREEVGAELREEDYVGRLDDVYGLKVDGIFSVHVACFIFKPQRELQLEANHEVADMVWLPISYLADATNSHDYRHPKDPALSMPSVLIDASKEQVLWGLSLRMLAIMHEVLQWPLPVLDSEQAARLKEIETRELSSSSLDSITKNIVDRNHGRR